MKKTLLSVMAIIAFACYTSAQTSLLTNGTFDGIEGPLVGRTADEWGMWSGNGGTSEVISGVATISPVMDAVNNWNMQLEQWNFAVVNDITYTASFDAWADADRVITLTIEDPANGYALLGATPDSGTTAGRSKWDVDITTTQTTYHLTLTVDAIQANTTPKFAFLVAQTADKVYIDNVSLIEGSNVGVRENKANAVKLYPNPAVNDLYISSKSKLSKVEIYNVVGTQVKEYGNVLQSVNVSDLKTGVYIVRLTDLDGKTVTSKFIKR